MAEGNDGQGWKQYLEAGMQFRELSRSQAQRLVRQLVKEGQLAEGRAKGYVEELVERSRQRTEDVRSFVRREIRSQLSSLGLATKDDLTRLEKKLTAAVAAKPKPAARSAAGKSAKAKKTPGQTGS